MIPYPPIGEEADTTTKKEIALEVILKESILTKKEGRAVDLQIIIIQ